MAAVAPVTTSPVPPPPVGGTASDPTRPSAPGPVSASPGQAPAPVLSTSDAAKVILAQPPASEPAPQQTQGTAPSAAEIQSALSAVILTLDNQPQEHPDSPAVVLLQNKETALRSALSQVLLDGPGAERVYLSGVVLNAAV